MSALPAGPLACPLCRSSAVAEFCSGAADARRKIEWPFRFFLCEECRLRFQLPSKDPTRLFEEQDQAEAARPSARRELRCDPDVLKRLSAIAPGRRLLEIGAGDGRFLESARLAGWDCLGVDVSERLAEFAARRSGARVLVGALADLRLPAGSFDVVNLDQVLMYVADPVGLLVEVRRLLSPGGLCRIREYDAESLSARRAGKTYWMYAPTHLLVWSRASIRHLSAASGLRLARVVSGTEASLRSWLETERSRGPAAVLRCAAAFIMRRAALFGLGLGADTVYYLEKPR